MKKHISNTLVVSSLLLSMHAIAGLDFPHVDGYDGVNEALFKDVKADTVPPSLITRSTIDNPGLSYSSLFPKSFLQEQLFAVCYENCAQKDVIKVSGGSVQANDKDSIEQANVYFWLKRYFNFLNERFGFTPAKHLKVMTNRSIKDPTAGKSMKNNAFFNPADTTLSFLPASNSWLFNAMNGKINRSGYDASVISHEASHFFFQHLFPDAINYEISGFNEGFADYIAQIHLNNPKVGLIMMRGKALRDASSLTDNDGKLKTYEPKLEAHDLGERMGMLVWKTRENATDKEEYDRMVIDAVKGMAENVYATAHTFKAEMLKRIPSLIPSDKLAIVKAQWDLFLPGDEEKVTDTSFLSKGGKANAYLGFKISQVISKKFADEMGQDIQNDLGFAFIREVKLNGGQTAMLMASENETITTPYWYVMDDKSGNILGIYGLDQKLITDRAQLKEISNLTSQVSSQDETITDFIKKARMFTDLTQGKGDLSSGYKVKNLETIPDSLAFNGEPTAIDRIEIQVKKKLLINLLVGLPDISKITLYTADKTISALPVVNKKTVIGWKLSFENGTSSEIILNKYAKPQ
ncbi:MAG: hypothetical protein ACJ76H_02530 [Bacteriovoracaceae bacterium]